MAGRARYRCRFIAGAGGLLLLGCPEINPNFMGDGGSSSATGMATAGTETSTTAGTASAGSQGDVGASSGSGSADNTGSGTGSGTDSGGTSTPQCGNGVRDPGEECDGRDVDAQVCGGGLSCNDDCTLDTTACCDDVPPQRGQCPDEFCESCDDNPCLANCNDDDECRDQAIDCPDGYECVVSCTGDDGCRGATINCPSAHACTVVCDAPNACQDAVVNCGTGPCVIECLTGGSSCDAAVNCGLGECTATCDGDSLPNLACGSACLCDPC